VIDEWRVRDNSTYAREGRCLLFASYSRSLRDCDACRTIAWCQYYDSSGIRQFDQVSLARWADDGGKELGDSLHSPAITY